MAVRRLLWWIAAILLFLAAVISYSPGLNRHANPAALAGLGCFFAGWAVGAAATID